MFSPAPAYILKQVLESVSQGPESGRSEQKVQLWDAKNGDSWSWVGEGRVFHIMSAERRLGLAVPIWRIG